MTTFAEAALPLSCEARGTVRDATCSLRDGRLCFSISANHRSSTSARRGRALFRTPMFQHTPMGGDSVSDVEPSIVSRIFRNRRNFSTPSFIRMQSKRAKDFQLTKPERRSTCSCGILLSSLQISQIRRRLSSPQHSSCPPIARRLPLDSVGADHKHRSERFSSATVKLLSPWNSKTEMLVKKKEKSLCPPFQGDFLPCSL
jgi:hypothetical protein